MLGRLSRPVCHSFARWEYRTDKQIDEELRPQYDVKINRKKRQL